MAALSSCSLNSSSTSKNSAFTDVDTNNDLNSERAQYDKLPPSNLRGWDHLANRLEKDGIEKDLIADVFSDVKMPVFGQVTFSLEPKESHVIYNIFLNPSRLSSAHDFYETWKPILKKAEDQYKVDGRIITTIMYVETGFGKNTGKHMVINRLSRLANIADPDNLNFNIRRLQKAKPGTTEEQVIKRAKYLEETFYPEVLALFRLASVRKLNLHSLQGSPAGAFGLPQFLPSSYVKFAIDGNKNGLISLFETEDSIFSVANFLSNYGWKNDGSFDEKIDVLWNYNRSRPYGETILKIAEKLGD